jgi:hypothetical protein
VQKREAFNPKIKISCMHLNVGKEFKGDLVIKALLDVIYAGFREVNIN